MRRTLIHIILLALVVTACDFRPLADMNNVSYVRVYIDEDITNVTGGYCHPEFRHPIWRRPDIFRIALYDTGSGDIVAERYLRHQGDDERGHFYDGYIIVDPGTYHFAAWNFGTETTVVDKENNLFRANASTREIYTRNRSDFESVRYDADHLLLAEERDINIPRHEKIDTLRDAGGNPFFTASSIVKSYYVQIGVKGSRWLSSASSLISGMSAGAHLYDRDITAYGETALSFGMTGGLIGGDEEHACIYSTFGTFGRLEGTSSELKITFEVVTTYGSKFEVTVPMDEVWLTEDALQRQWLIIDEEIEIPEPPEPEEGGMNPAVDDWGDVESDIVI